MSELPIGLRLTFALIAVFGGAVIGAGIVTVEKALTSHQSTMSKRTECASCVQWNCSREE